jgi:N utilization substance protein B
LATRTHSREVVISLLYALDLGNDNIDSFVDEILEDKKIRNKQKEFALSLYRGVVENLDEIDKNLSKLLAEWSLQEIGNIERAILRLGAYEILFTSIDKAIIINEAIELSKKLTSQSSPKLINGVLDSL